MATDSKPAAKRDLQEAHRRRQQRESLLETLESIVVAFILAFIFRAFVVEAFVIPTGSMAPTLNGDHMELTCPDCGYEFAVGHDRGVAHEFYRQVWCPNCAWRLEPAGPQPLYSGDRILVLKYLYDFQQPARWDVIVFRNPNDEQENFIKRLVALPGETVEIVDGNVTIDGQIVTKTDKAQEALWMIVHDTRRRAVREDAPTWWYPGGGWQIDGSGYRLPSAPAEAAWLEFHETGPPVMGEVNSDGLSRVIGDYYAYNATEAQNCVTDLSLTTLVTLGAEKASVVIEMRAWLDRLRWELTAEGSGRPSRMLVGDKVVAESADGVLPVGREVRVQAANVDHKLMLLIDGRRPLKALTAAVTVEGDPRYEPTPISLERRRELENEPDGPARVQVGAKGGPVALAYLDLERDVYYTSDEPGNGTEGHPFTLEADQFFVLGDNSPKSHDSRYWRVGPVVKRRNLVGKAFFVYWPSAGKRWGIPLAPNLKGYRFVH